MSFDWSSLIIFSGIINTLISFAILILKKSKYKIKFLIWIILILALVGVILLEKIIRFSDLVASYPELLFISSPLFFFILPMIFLFQKSLIRTLKYWYLHFLIPVILLILLLPTIAMDNSDKLKMYFTEGINDPIWIIVFYLLFAIFYIGKTLIENRKHKEELLNEYASNDVELQLFSTQLVFLSSMLMIIIPVSLSIQYLDFNAELADKWLFILFSIIPHLILISILANNNIGDYTIELTEDEKQKSTNSKDENLETLKSELLYFMLNQKPYLNQNLNLQGLANLINWNRSDLSMIINKGFEKNFYDFINEYRLNLVIEKLHNGEYKNYSLDYIVSESGFKNYTSFYRIFKRNKQESPNSYVKRLKKNTNTLHNI